MRKVFFVFLFSLFLHPAHADDTLTLARGKMAVVALDRSLYAITDSNVFCIHIIIYNTTDDSLGVDLNSFFETIYLNMWWVEDPTMENSIDEMRSVYSPPDRASVKSANFGYAEHRLKMIPPHGKLDYYSSHGMEKKQDVLHDAAKGSHPQKMMLSLNGQLLICNGKTLQDVHFSDEKGLKGNTNNYWLALPWPVNWKAAPAGALFLWD